MSAGLGQGTYHSYLFYKTCFILTCGNISWVIWWESFLRVEKKYDSLFFSLLLYFFPSIIFEVEKDSCKEIYLLLLL